MTSWVVLSFVCFSTENTQEPEIFPFPITIRQHLGIWECNKISTQLSNLVVENAIESSGVCGEKEL